MSDATPRDTVAQIATLIVALVAAVGGMWLGEALEAPMWAFAQLGLLAGSLGSVVAFLGRPPWRKAVARALIVALVASTAFWTGRASGRHAFNSCVEHRSELREALEEHKAREGGYPVDLGQLAPELPGGRLLRGSILSYQVVGTGYRLRFGDWLVEHSATDVRDWNVRK